MFFFATKELLNLYKNQLCQTSFTGQKGQKQGLIKGVFNESP
jgi:hypothetical protein